MALPSEDDRTERPPARGAPWLALTAAPLAVAAVFLARLFHEPWPAHLYVPAHVVVEVLVVVVAGSTFALQWYAGRRVADARASLVGHGFLAVAALEIAHLLAFPGMPGLPWLPASTERGIVYWLAARFVTVGTLVGAYTVGAAGLASVLRRVPPIALTSALVVGVLAADALWIAREPRFFVEGMGLTPLKVALEAVLVAAALLAVAVIGRRRTADAAELHGFAALWLTALGEICFALYAGAHDGFNVLGHVYLLFAFREVWKALFAAAVARPYAQLARSHAETERLRHRIEAELEVTIRNLRTVQEQQQDFLRAVSHDLRTPLQVVLLQAERLQRAHAEGSAEARSARSIAAAGRQMSTMLQDLLDAIHLESGTVALSRATITLPEFVDDVLAVSAGALQTDRVRQEWPRRLPAVSGDPARLTRVVQNLVGNALKYSGPDTPVTVRGRAAGGEVVVEVQDRGPGIAADDVPRLFTRFYRGAQKRTTGGLGLGLFISRLVVEAHGGRIWCESRPGEGATFAFALPSAGDPARRGTAGAGQPPAGA